MKVMKALSTSVMLVLALPANAFVVCSQLTNEHSKAFHYSMNGQANFLRGFERSKIYASEVVKPDNIAQRYRLLGEALIVTGESVEVSSKKAFYLQVEPLRDKTRHHCDVGYLLRLTAKR